MPALKFMGRRWGVGGDEFAIPSMCSMTLRILWSATLVIIMLVLAGLGLALVTVFDSTCEGALSDSALNTLIIAVTASQLIDILLTCCCCLLMAGNQHDGGWELHQPNHTLYERFPADEIEGQWARRCKLMYRFLGFCTCGLFGGSSRDADFSQLSRVMARIFHTEEYLDIVPSDIAAGIVLLHHQQKEVARASVEQADQACMRGAAALREKAHDQGEWHIGGRDDNHEREEDLEAWGSREAGKWGIPPSIRMRSVEHKKFYAVRGKQLLDMDNQADRAALEEVEHFAYYSLAIYTWYIYLFKHPCCGACDLMCHSCRRLSEDFHRHQRMAALEQAGTQTLREGGRRRGRRRRSRRRSLSSQAFGQGRMMPEGAGAGGGAGNMTGLQLPEIKVEVEGDNWMGVHEAALLKMAGLHNCELVFAHFGNGLRETPYCIMVDHNWECIVVSIRGTMSLDDCLTDLQAEPGSMEAVGIKWGFDGRGMYAHQGVLDRASWIRGDLEERGHLRHLFSDKSGQLGEKSSDCPLSMRYGSYSLRVVGHSLGGSVAVLVAYMLRPMHPSVRCVAISPMGGVLSAPHAQGCSSFVLSVALSHDIVPRLSVRAVERVRDSVLDLLARSKVNKITVMRSLVHGMDQDVNSYLYGGEEDVPETGFLAQLRRYREWVEHQRATSPVPDLLTPGRIIHLVKTNTIKGWCGSKTSEYTPVWATPEDFADIVVSRRMFVDHIITLSIPALTDTLRSLVHNAG